MFKAYKVIIIQKYRDLWGNKLYFLYELLTPLAYGAIFFLQAIFIYSAKQNAFDNLSREAYILGIVSAQTVFMLGNYNSMASLATEVLNTQFDFVLLRPINLFFHKYLREWGPIEIFMALFYVTLAVVYSFIADLTLITGIKLAIFIVIAALIRQNFFGFIISWVFFLRNWDHVYKVDSIMAVANTTPQEVFVKPLKFTLTYILPAIVIFAFLFEIIRGRDGVFLWSLLISWLVLSMSLNHIFWKKGIKKYESFS